MLKHISSSSSEIRPSEPREELLGAFLADPSLFEEYRHQLSAELFPGYEWLYKTIVEVSDTEGLSFKGVASRCDLTEIKILHELRGAFFNEHRIPGLIQQVKKEHLSRQIHTIAINIINQTHDGEDPDGTLRYMQEKAFSLYSSESDIGDQDKDLDEWAQYMLEIAEDPSKAFGLMTGIQSLDTLTTGFHRQDFSVIGARTSMGKSAFVIELLLRLHQAGYKCAMFSLEMTKRQLFNRMICNLMQVSLEMFRMGRLAKNHYETMLKRKEELRGIYINETRGISADYIADEMRRLKRTQGLDFVVVDYLQDVQEPGEANDNSGSALSRICRKLRKAAMICDCHVMGLSQVVRDVEKRDNKRPGSADLSGSTGIETSADVIALLYRDDYYNPDTDKKNILEVNFTKQRNGKLGKVELHYDRELQKIRDIR